MLETLLPAMPAPSRLCARTSRRWGPRNTARVTEQEHEPQDKGPPAPSSGVQIQCCPPPALDSTRRVPSWVRKALDPCQGWSSALPDPKGFRKLLAPRPHACRAHRPACPGAANCSEAESGSQGPPAPTQPPGTGCSNNLFHKGVLASKPARS